MGKWEKENVVRTPEHGGRADVLGQAVERERGDDRAGLAARGGHAVCGRAEARREDLGGVAVCRPTVAAIRLGLAHGAHGGEQRASGREGTYVLAPKLKKNWRNAKQTMNAGVLSSWNLPARMPTAHKRNRERSLSKQ